MTDQQILADLARVRVLFQARTIALHLGAAFKSPVLGASLDIPEEKVIQPSVTIAAMDPEEPQ